MDIFHMLLDDPEICSSSPGKLECLHVHALEVIMSSDIKNILLLLSGKHACVNAHLETSYAGSDPGFPSPQIGFQ